MRKAVSLLAVALTASSLAAQLVSTYSPSYALGQVNSNNVWPYGTAPMRYMQIHDTWTFTSTKTLLARGLAYRPTLQSFGFNKPAASTEVMLRIGVAPNGVTSQTPATTFDGNFDAASVKTVFTRKVVNYPNSGTTLDELKIFDISFPFDSATFFLWNGTSANSLTIETRCYASQGGYPFDFAADLAVRGNGYSVENGAYAGCNNNANKVVEHEVQTDKLFVGSPNATLIGRSFLPSIPGILSIGATAINATIPGTSCNLVNDPLLLIPGLTDAAGDLNIVFPLPNDPNLHRVSFYSQVVFVDVAANGPGVITTRGFENGIGAGAIAQNLGIIRMRTTGDPDAATTIANTYANGLVIKLNP